MSAIGAASYPDEECMQEPHGDFHHEFEIASDGRKTPIHSIENENDQSFASVTAIHVVDGGGEEDPFADDESEPSFYDQNGQDHSGQDGVTRKVSEISFSTMPDEPPFHESFVATDTQDNADTNGWKAISPTRQNVSASEYTRLISPSQKRLMASRETSRGSPLSPLAHNRVSATVNPGTPHRNGSAGPKSARISSPSHPPFSQSPRSARVRKGDGTGQNFLSTPTRSVTQETTARRTPSYANPMLIKHSSRSGTPQHPHSNPRKEYPLVLLHCNINLLQLPYPEHLLATYLPLSVQENLALLREKLSATVLERGVLLSHPGDDYDVLEERVLESLELKIPRVGRCGHFLGSGTATPRNEAQTDDAVENAPDDYQTSGTTSGNKQLKSACSDCTCPTCNSHISHAANGLQRRWDIRVYAANGLMRSGAWGAAWREMEKVDIEIGIWIAEEVRRVLETEAIKEAERWEESVVEKYEGDDSQIGPRPVEANGIAKDSEEDNTRGFEEATTFEQQRPLSELMLNYVKRTLASRPEILLHILIAVLGITYLTRSPSSLTTPAAAALHLKPVTQTVTAEPMKDMHTTTVTVALTPTPSATTHYETVSQQNVMPGCTFSVGQEGQYGMTALSKELASRVLNGRCAEETHMRNGVFSDGEVNPTGAEDQDIPDDGGF